MCNACAYTRALVEILWHFLQILFPFSKKTKKKRTTNKKLYYYFTSALSNYLCDKIVHEGFANHVHQGSTGGFLARNDSERKKTKKLRDSNISWIDDWWLMRELLPYVRKANERAGWNFKLTCAEPAQFTIYDKEQFYFATYDPETLEIIIKTQKKVIEYMKEET